MVEKHRQRLKELEEATPGRPAEPGRPDRPALADDRGQRQRRGASLRLGQRRSDRRGAARRGLPDPGRKRPDRRARSRSWASTRSRSTWPGHHERSQALGRADPYRRNRRLIRRSSTVHDDHRVDSGLRRQSCPRGSDAQAVRSTDPMLGGPSPSRGYPIDIARVLVQSFRVADADGSSARFRVIWIREITAERNEEFDPATDDGAHRSGRRECRHGSRVVSRASRAYERGDGHGA